MRDALTEGAGVAIAARAEAVVPDWWGRAGATLASPRFREAVALVAVLGVAVFLHFYRLERQGFANLYYAAAVKSMLTSWHNFFFASFDPGGYVSVDKAPLGLWVQAAFARVLGFHGLSLLLPQALAGVASVALLYQMVRRAFGVGAGLIAALVLALTPISVAADRNNTQDALVVLTSLLAAWAVLRAVESGRARWLMVSMLLIGIGFNIKMLQAFMVLPAIYLAYAVAAPQPVRGRVLQLAAGTLVLALVSFSWAAAVDLTPAERRPFVGSSRDNTEFDLIVGHNGVQRLGSIARLVGLGNVGRPARPAAGPTPPPRPSQTPGGGAGPQAGGGPSRAPDGAGPGGLGQETGPPGVLRLFNHQLAGQATWLLPLAAAGLLTGLALTLFERGGARGLADPRAKARGSGGPRARFASLVLWAGWLGPQVVFFSFAGLFHRYYLEMMAPAIGAGVGTGVVILLEAHKRGGASLLLALALAGSAMVELVILRDARGWTPWLSPLVFGTAVTAALALLAWRRLPYTEGLGPEPVVALAVLGLLLAPAAWAGITVSRAGSAGLPFAGPDLPSRQAGLPAARPRQTPEESRLTAYLAANHGGERFYLATMNANTAAPVILATAWPVMALGGFSGGDPILTTEALAAKVAGGEVRFFLLPEDAALQPGAPLAPNQQTALTRWVSARCAPVPEALWRSGGGAGPNTGQRLWDCGRVTGR